ncbi:hypothetical protein GCM10007377_11190 [Galliscardovia ingluviei]|uniref:Uncharacterized protein n=1 Tax=Galliscardovia ingluviei TaxID=1769422 RepID=A0A8J3AIP8_9BIFI|nr:hypothetical protein [Galliscardovia ingluviei]GGI14489.1 hypothetical protein GCM10007377_11190 [Galliscardovia ingluviei]
MDLITQSSYLAITTIVAVKISLKQVLITYLPFWICVTGVISIWGIYRLLEKENSSSLQYGFNTYMTLVEVSSHFWEPKRVTRFFSYAIFPPALIFFLQAAILSRESTSTAVIFWTLPCTAFLYYFPTQLIACIHEYSFSRKLYRLGLTVLFPLLALLIAYISSIVDFSDFAPSFTGTVDGLWGILLGALIVRFYIQTVAIKSSDSNKQTHILPPIEQERFVQRILKSKRYIDTKFGPLISEMCEKYYVNPYIFQAILIFENLNRPVLIRKLENILVRLTSQQMTVGIAQVMSCTPLTDSQSIIRAAQILKATAGKQSENEIKAIAYHYNQSNEYSNTIFAITSILLEYGDHINIGIHADE